MTSAISCWNGYGLIVEFIYKFGSRALLLSMGVKTKTAPKFVEAKSKVFSWDGDWLNGYRIDKFQHQALIFCVDAEVTRADAPWRCRGGGEARFSAIPTLPRRALDLKH